MIAAVLAAAVALQPGTVQSFEEIDQLPKEWQVVEYTPNLSTAVVKAGRAADGRQFLRLSAKQENHTRVLMPVPVEPGTTYRLSAQVRAEGEKTVPAVFALDGAMETSEHVPGDGKWHQRELYLKTGSSKTVLITLSLGWFGDLAGGRADFDTVKLDRVEGEPPAEAVVASVPSAEPAADASPATPAESENGPSKLILPLGVLLALGVAAMGFRLRRRGDVSD